MDSGLASTRSANADRVMGPGMTAFCLR